jgi:hypothetical protein
MVLAKERLVDTCNRYEVAPVEEFQLSVGLVGTPVEPSEGEESVGAGGLASPAVVKLHAAE